MNHASQDDLARLTSGCGYVAWDDRTIVELKGPDARTFLHRFCTNDIERLEAGQGCEAFLTTVQGKTLGHVLVSVNVDSVILETVLGQAPTIISHLDRYLFNERVELVDQSGAFCQWLLAGAHWHERLANSVPAPLPEPTGSSIAAQLGGANVQLIGTPYANAPSILVRASRSATTEVEKSLAEFEGTRCDGAALEWQRIQKGFPWYGRDFDGSNLPQELDRNQLAISFTKGCYLGQETIARLDAMGHVNKMLRGLIFEASDLERITEGPEVQMAGKVVGQLTSVASNGKQPIGLGILRRIASEPGTCVNVNGAAAIVSAFPIG